MSRGKRVAIQIYNSEELPKPHGSSIVVRRARRPSVDAGSLASARASMEREQERSAQKTHSAQKAMDDARESVASHLVTVGSMFTMFDEEHEGFLHRKGFIEAMAALGSDRQAASDIFDELDVYSRDKIHYGAYLECALRDGLSRVSERVVQLCRQIDQESTQSGLVGRDEFRLAVERLGWEKPPLCKPTYTLNTTSRTLPPRTLFPF